MHKRLIFGSCALVLFAVTPVVAQIRDAGSKITGSAYREWSAQSYGRAAYSHAEALGEYSRSYSYIPAETVREHAAEVHRNITAAKQELAKLAPQAKDNKAVARHVETLQKHYDNALEHTRTLQVETAKGDSADAKRVTSATEGLMAELQGAGTEHDKLIETLKSDKSN
jgi:uncharacterized protein (DUF3084 family)